MKITFLKGLIFQNKGKSTTVYDPEGAVFYTFNPTASLIISELKAGASLENIAQKIENEFETTLDEASRDITDFINQLKSKKIVRVTYVSKK